MPRKNTYISGNIPRYRFTKLFPLAISTYMRRDRTGHTEAHQSVGGGGASRRVSVEVQRTRRGVRLSKRERERSSERWRAFGGCCRSVSTELCCFAPDRAHLCRQGAVTTPAEETPSGIPEVVGTVTRQGNRGKTRQHQGTRGWHVRQQGHRGKGRWGLPVAKLRGCKGHKAAGGAVKRGPTEPLTIE